MDDDMLAAMANQAQAETRTTVPENKELEQKDITAEDNEVVGDTQDFSRTPWEDRTPEERGEVEEPSQTETDTETNESETNTDTETETNTNTETSESTDETNTAAVEEDPNAWLATLPEAPADFALTAPQFDEEGNLTNMSGQEFLTYTVELAKHEAKTENYNNVVMNRSMDVAEQILPEMKDNPHVRTLFENQLVAMTVNGNGNAADAARAIAQLRSDSTAAGASAAKSRIEVIKNSSVESPSKSETTSTANDKQLAARLKSNDTTAFDELFGAWMEEGKV